MNEPARNRFSLAAPLLSVRLIRIVMLSLLILLSRPIIGAEGDVWTVTQAPTVHDLVRIEMLDQLTGWAAGDSGAIIKTTDGGDTWAVQNSTTQFDIKDISFSDANHGWALAHEYPSDTIQTFGTYLLRTTDGGENWFLQRRLGDFYYHSIKFIDSTKGFMGGDLGRLFWSEDGGGTWVPAVIDSPDYARWSIYRFNFYDSLYGFAMGGRYDITGLVWKTTDGGKFWDHTRVAGEPVFDSYFIDSTNILCVSGDLDIGSGMVRTSNAGEDWVYTYLGIWGQASSVSFRTPAEVWGTLGFASTYMVSYDSGYTWTSTFTPDSSRVFDIVFVDSTCGFIVGGEGTILRYTGPPANVSEGGHGLPNRMTLLQNYPNPFNPETTIRYSLTEKSAVEVIVVDLSGREVARLDRGIEPPGTHEVLFNANAIASGVYICRISVRPIGEAAPVHRSIKMVFLR